MKKDWKKKKKEDLPVTFLQKEEEKHKVIKDYNISGVAEAALWEKFL